MSHDTHGTVVTYLSVCGGPTSDEDYYTIRSCAMIHTEQLLCICPPGAANE